ncbi:MAG TPA: dihydroorotase [Leucothrix mucor]|nr:dihydroorotase [Leucothrix mucor]
MSTLLILNATIVNENSIVESDIYIRNGRIEKIGKDLSRMKVLQVMDVKGKHVIPGMIDDNVHFKKENESAASNLYSESQAAVAGGITTFFDMPDSLPHTVDLQTLEDKMSLASEKSLANYSFYLGVGYENTEIIKSLDHNLNCGLKICMGDARGNMLVDRPEIVEEVFKSSPTLIAAHCEDMPMITENLESYRQIYGDEIPFELHPKIRSDEACYQSTKLAIEIAKANDTRLHVLHVSSAKEVELFENTPLDEKRITAEVCYPYLDFAEDDYIVQSIVDKQKKSEDKAGNDKDNKDKDNKDKDNKDKDNKDKDNKDKDIKDKENTKDLNYFNKGALIKCNPSIKTEIDRAALFQGLMNDRLDNIATAHTVVNRYDKEGDYFQVKSGMPSAQYALPSLLEHYQDGIFTLESIVQKTSHAVADLFNIKERGYIREGYWADLVVVDINKPWTVSTGSVLSSSGWTPYLGEEFRSSVYATIVNGNLVYINDTVRTDAKKGKRVEFERAKAV